MPALKKRNSDGTDTILGGGSDASVDDSALATIDLAITSETTRATAAEALITTPLTWGDLTGIRTWADINNEISTWATAQNFTWGDLASIPTWAHVYQTGKTWADAQNYTWSTL